MTFFENWGPTFRLDAATRGKLLKISQATIDRKLKAAKQLLALRGTSGTKHGTLLRSQILVRTHFPFDERQPGFFEAVGCHQE
jgi:hypothetical protein